VSGSAKITSIDAVDNFRLALIKFNDNASRALMSVDEQIKRVMHWFEHEAPSEWNMRIRRCHEELSRARAALETARMRKVGDNRPACIEEQQAVREAQRKLAHAQQMLEILKTWTNRVRQACDDYRGGVMGLRTTLDVRVPETIGILSRTVRALDAYAERARDPLTNSAGPTSTSRAESPPPEDPGSQERSSGAESTVSGQSPSDSSAE